VVKEDGCVLHVGQREVAGKASSTQCKKKRGERRDPRGREEKGGKSSLWGGRETSKSKGFRGYAGAGKKGQAQPKADTRSSHGIGKRIMSGNGQDKKAGQGKARKGCSLLIDLKKKREGIMENKEEGLIEEVLREES